MIVPGSWTRGGYTPGQTPGTPEEEARKPWVAWRMYDNYGFPAEWDAMNTAWYRRKFPVAAVEPDQRYFIYFGGILRESWIYVNGREVGRTLNGTMPSEVEVTGALHDGDNELAVYITDYRRDEKGKVLVPTGFDQMDYQKGIWQDVFLRIRPDCHIEDVTLRTSVRRNELTVLLALRNASGRRHEVAPSFVIHDRDVPQRRFAAAPVTLEPGERKTVTVTHPWKSYIPWSTHAPHLYHLETCLSENENLLDQQRERFGFREVWIEGPHVMLNGVPQHMFGDWCHRSTLDVLRPEYIRQWFGMLKDCHMNYTRTHMFPHNPTLLDLADEMGILVCLESSFAFGGQMALDKAEFWQGAKQHVRDIVRRDKNHPSIVLWSVGNETRWSGNQNAVIQHAPRLRRLYETLDPTRIPYHDGDSTLWDERTQHLLSRHYGFECTGEGWWDKRQPLHVGEVGKWHYGQPLENCVWGDDRIFGSFAECHRAIARETADLAEQARANEAACLFPWNLSGLDNYRPWPKEHTFEWPEAETPGVKIFRTAPYTSEFAWWEPEGKGYVPGVSFDIMRHAFRPLAVVVREKQSRFFDDAKIKHTVTVINDTGGAVTGMLSVAVRQGATTCWQTRQELTVAPGHVAKTDFSIPAPRVAAVTDLALETSWGDTARIFDTHSRRVRMTPAAVRNARWTLPVVALFGNGSMKKTLAEHKVKTARISSLARLDPRKTPVVLIEKQAIQPGSKQNQELLAFLEKGGRAVMLEQSACVMPGTAVDAKPSERCHIRGGQQDVLKGFTAEDFEFWGNDPYGKTNSDSWVVYNPYRKPAKGACRLLLHSGFGDFGKEGMQWAPLLEVRAGRGMLIACQLRITEKAASHPVTLALLKRFLEYAARWRAPATTPVELFGAIPKPALERMGVQTTESRQTRLVLADGRGLRQADAGMLARRAERGATVVVVALDKPGVRRLARALGTPMEPVDLGRQYQLVRPDEHPLLEGTSNQETFWLDKVTYAGNAENRPMTDVLIRCPRGEVLLASEWDSCWREFFTLGASSERLRMPVVTYTLWGGPRDHAAGMLRVKHGKGAVIICQVPPASDDYPKADVFWAQFLGRLGARFNPNLFAGDAVKAGSRCGDGFPTLCAFIANPAETLFKDILKVAYTNESRLYNHAISQGFNWTKLETPAGVLELKAAADEVLVMFQIHVERLRMAAPVEGGWPDPSQQTLLDMTGSGRVTLYVNGRSYEPVALGAGQKGTVADIDLDKVNNTILLCWKPAGGKLLGLQWRNRQGQPEVEFLFVM